MVCVSMGYASLSLVDCVERRFPGGGQRHPSWRGVRIRGTSRRDLPTAEPGPAAVKPCGGWESTRGTPYPKELPQMITYLILVAISGLFVGALARLALPGRDPMGLFTTMLVGI